MHNAPRGVRLTIALAGRRNAGKSSLINALVGQEVAIVSDTPGTTTDPVAKAYELLPLGPVTFYDTAGLDDEGELGLLRVAATRKVLWRADMVLLVLGPEGLGPLERGLVHELRDAAIPVVATITHRDLQPPRAEDLAWLQERGLPTVAVSARTGHGLDELKAALLTHAPEDFRVEPPLVGDLVGPGDTVVCVVPIDLAAPKGRLILPQVQVLRDLLDHDALGLVVKERELDAALDGLRRPPRLVITDSQAILKVTGSVPEDVPLTTFSMIMARAKGDLATLVAGAAAMDRLRDGDAVLIAEACSHHVVADDIGRVKIPRWLTAFTGRDLRFQWCAGHDFPDDLERFALVIHCGACMIGRAETMRRIRLCSRLGVPITNYGVAISKLHGVLERTVRPFGLDAA